MLVAIMALEPPVDPLAADWPRARAEGNPWNRLLGRAQCPALLLRRAVMPA